MTQKIWNELSFFEQMSNIDGDVERLIRAHEKFLNGESDVDNSDFYLNKIISMVKMTLLDEKNLDKGYRAVELYDEIEEIRKYLNSEYPSDYIRRYWNSYTNAISV